MQDARENNGSGEIVSDALKTLTFDRMDKGIEASLQLVLETLGRAADVISHQTAMASELSSLSPTLPGSVLEDLSRSVKSFDTQFNRAASLILDQVEAQLLSKESVSDSLSKINE